MKFKPAFASILFSSVALQSCSSGHDDAFAVTPEIVPAYVKSVKDSVEQTVEQIVSTPDHEKSYETTMKPWTRLGEKILADMGVIYFLAETDASPENPAPQAMQEIGGFLAESLIYNPDVYRSMLAYAGKVCDEASGSTPYEAYLVGQVLNSSSMIWPALAKADQKETQRLKDLNSGKKQEAFQHLQGNAAEKIASTGGAFTVLNLNTCFLPGKQALFYGGMSPWEMRVTPLANKILSTKADIICLQEVFEEEAAFALYEKLKGAYAHFYVSIGPRPLGFALQHMGRSSGLFIASKFAVESPSFTLFQAAAYPMNFGCFDFVVKSGKTSLGHVYATHLQPLNFEKFPEVRAAQLSSILEKMGADLAASSEKIPYFLCGDLNIPWGKGEPGEALVRSNFFDAYNNGRKEVTENDWTCTDYYTNYFLAKEEGLDPNFQILDYSLLLQSLPGHAGPISQGFTIKTEKVIANMLMAPEAAITDHQGLLTTVRRASVH